MELECWLHTMMFVSLLLATLVTVSYKVDSLKTQVLYTSYPTGLVPLITACNGHIQLVPRATKCETLPLYPYILYGVVL